MPPATLSLHYNSNALMAVGWHGGIVRIIYQSPLPPDWHAAVEKPGGRGNLFLPKAITDRQKCAAKRYLRDRYTGAHMHTGQNTVSIGRRDRMIRAPTGKMQNWLHFLWHSRSGDRSHDTW